MLLNNYSIENCSLKGFLIQKWSPSIILMGPILHTDIFLSRETCVSLLKAQFSISLAPFT